MKMPIVFKTHKDFVRLKYPKLKESDWKKAAYEIITNYPLYYANIKLQIMQNEELLIRN